MSSRQRFFMIRSSWYLSYRCCCSFVVLFLLFDNHYHYHYHGVTAANNNLPSSTTTSTTSSVQKRMVGTILPSDLSDDPTIYTNWQQHTMLSTSSNNKTATTTDDVQTISFHKRTKVPITIIVDNNNNNDDKDSNEIIKIKYKLGSVKQSAYKKPESMIINTDVGSNSSSSSSNDYEAKISSTSVDDTTINSTTTSTSTNNGLDVSFSVLPSLVTRTEVQNVLQLLNQYDKDFFDDDPDTVDGMPSYEIFVSNPDMMDQQEQQQHEQHEQQKIGKYKDYTDHQSRRVLRQQLQKILQPIIHERITPYIKWKYPQLCDPDHSNGRRHECMACYSLIRRYKYGERKSHAIHHDGHAIVTAVTSLSDYDTHYRGGLYVVSPQDMILNQQKTNHDTNNYYDYHTLYNDTKIRNNFQFLKLNAGDTAVHTSTLLHGVKVYDKEQQPELTERWSWILWYKDVNSVVTPSPPTTNTTSLSSIPISTDSNRKQDTNHNDDECFDCCKEDHSHMWFEQCAKEGDMICQQLHSTKGAQNVTEVIYWNQIAAKQGASTSAIKMARAHLHQLNVIETMGSGQNIVLVPYNITMAYQYYNIAIQANNNPEGHYGIAELVLTKLKKRQEQNLKQLQQKKKKKNISDNDENPFLVTPYVKKQLQRVIYHLEQAAMAGHVFSMFNLGIAHTYGYGIYYHPPPSQKNNNSQKTTEHRSLSIEKETAQMNGIINPTIARDWYVKSGLPEGYYVASFQAASQNDEKKQKYYMEQATILGYHQPWRKVAREQTGSGGVGNIDLNLPWPISEDGRIPPKF